MVELFNSDSKRPCRAGCPYYRLIRIIIKGSELIITTLHGFSGTKLPDHNMINK